MCVCRGDRRVGLGACRRPISAFDTPSAASKTIRARWATPAPAVEHRNTALNLDSSPGRNTIGAATDIPQCPELQP